MVERSCLVLLNSPSQQGVDHFNFVPWNLHGISTPSNPKKNKFKSLEVCKFPAYFKSEINKNS